MEIVSNLQHYFSNFQNCFVSHTTQKLSQLQIYSAFQKDMQIDNKAIVSTVLVFNIQTINRNYRYTYM